MGADLSNPGMQLIYETMGVYCKIASRAEATRTIRTTNSMSLSFQALFSFCSLLLFMFSPLKGFQPGVRS